MSIQKRIKSILHSLIAKVILLILAMAITIILTIAYHYELIFSSDRTHHTFLLFVILAIIFVSSGFFFHRLLRPIKQLNEGVKQISKGNLDIKLNINSNDEVGKLAQAFNQMARDLSLMIEAREQLLLDVSHELRTPLTRAMLALEMAGESEFNTTAKRNIKEVETMIRELLETQRLRNSLDQIETSTINIRDFLSTIYNEYKNINERIKLNPISETININADGNLLKITIRNIIDNAIKYSNDSIKEVEISVIDKEETIEIIIEDFGPGIPENEITKVFEPFYRADKSRSRKTGGYGLGLHLCKRIMEAHHGNILIKNKNDSQGLMVTLSIKCL